MSNDNVLPQAYCHGCGKRITLRKNGAFRMHRSFTPERAGSPFKAICEYSGKEAQR